MSNFGIASVPRQASPTDKKTIDPRATRYGLIPIFSQQVSARDFYVHRIRANSVFPFRPFIGEIGKDHKGRETYRVERLPADQIDDLQRMSSYFVELPELAKLSEDRAALVVGALGNPSACTKYPIDLGQSCATCWQEYLFSEKLAERIDALEDNDLKRAANASAVALKSALQKAIDRARELVDEAIRDIDDPTKGKKQFYEFDYLNIYHTHTDRPKYKTQTSNTDSAQAIADAIRSIAQPQAPGLDPAVLAEMVAQAVEAATAPLKEKLAEYEKPDPVETKAAKLKEKLEKDKN